MMTPEAYLTIPEGAYGRWLGELRWEGGFEAIVGTPPDAEIGLTFVMGHQVALFLSGLSADGSFLHFGLVLHLMKLIGYGHPDEPTSKAYSPLVKAFEAAGRPLRNAGALAAALSRGVPTLPDPPNLGAVQVALRKRVASGHDRSYGRVVIEPPLRPETFAAMVRKELRRFSDDDLAHWLRHGRGPGTEAGEAIARVLPEPNPPTLAEILTEMGRRPRLRASASLVARLTGALALPPRRLAHSDLPQGGYTDVATRGLAEQILPGQFALDTEEFLRRFSEHELLYYHREEPHEPSARELVLVADQGVRTWGDVRVVLAASALALGRQAVRRGLTLRVATTGNGGEVVDAEAAGPEALAALLESSDLTANPASALRQVLDPAGLDRVPRDVVLLTHPRSLREPELAEATRRPPDGTRLFAVSADAAGEVVLSEVRRGGAIPVARCRVSFDDPTIPKPDVTPPSPFPNGPWHGEVEPVPYVFLIGATSRIDDHLFDFDDGGEWLLHADRRGLLRAWRADGSGLEMLPRATVEGRVLTAVKAVVGVAGGFVVVGLAGDRLALAYYDCRRRTCKVFRLTRPWHGTVPWTYAPKFHSVVTTGAAGRALAVDLASDPGRACYPSPGEGVSLPALQAYRWYTRKPRELIVLSEGDTLPVGGPLLIFDAQAGSIRLRDSDGNESSFRPMSNGEPSLVGSKVLRARWREPVVAVLLSHQQTGARSVQIYPLSDHGRLKSLAEHSVGRDVADFALSRDGRLVAWRTGNRRLIVRDVAATAKPPVLTHKGKVHNNLTLHATDGFLATRAGEYAHVIRWDRGVAEFHTGEGDVRQLLSRLAMAFPVSNPIERISPANVPGYAPKDSDGRFSSALRLGEVILAADHHGQVSMLRGGRVVCTFFFLRDEAAALMPDGTRLGPPYLTGGPPTPDGRQRLGEAIREAFANPRHEAPR